MTRSERQRGMSNDAKILVAVLLLLFIYPIGLIFMWGWTNWSKSLKWIITIPMIATVIIIFLAIISTLLTVGNRTEQKLQVDINQKAVCLQQCKLDEKNTECINACMSDYALTPTTSSSLQQ